MVCFHPLASLALAATASPFLASLASAESFPDPSWEDYLGIDYIVRKWIDDSSCPDIGDVQTHWDWAGGTSTNCALFQRGNGEKQLGPKLVRLAFHDAAGFADGHVEASTDNAGLDAATTVLDDYIYQSTTLLPNNGKAITSVISRADLYAWAGAIAMEYFAESQTPGADDVLPVFPIRFGRESFDSASGALDPVEDFPNMGTDSNERELSNYFRNKFGLTADQTVTIMGAHSIGQAQRANSGYAGTWTHAWEGQHLVFDHTYYQTMDLTSFGYDCTGDQIASMECPALDCADSANADRCHGWEQVQMGPTTFQWRHSCSDSLGTDCVGLMLNADMALLYNLEGHLNDERVNDAGNNGMITSFPAGSHCGTFVQGTSRVFAHCFERKYDPATDSALIDQYMDDSVPGGNSQFMANFPAAYDMLVRNAKLQDGRTGLGELTRGSSGLPYVSNGGACPTSEYGCSDPGTGAASWDCYLCEGGQCGVGLNDGLTLCRPESWSYVGEEPNTGDCPGFAEAGGECDPGMLPDPFTTEFKFTCYGCLSDTCIVDCDGNARCKRENYNEVACTRRLDSKGNFLRG